MIVNIFFLQLLPELAQVFDRRLVQAYCFLAGSMPELHLLCAVENEILQVPGPLVAVNDEIGRSKHPEYGAGAGIVPGPEAPLFQLSINISLLGEKYKFEILIQAVQV